MSLNLLGSPQFGFGCEFSFWFCMQLSSFKKAIEDMAEESLRCVAIAYRPCDVENVPSGDEELENWQLPESELILLAIVGIKVCATCSVLTVACSFCLS